jgi:phosphoglycolate phosphatase
MFRLSDLLAYENIIIQCHDHPDADTIASAFGVYAYLKRKGKDAKIIYSGFDQIKKRNIQLMLEWLNIPIEYVKTLEKSELLICMDCQYGEGNITKFEAETIAVIDHHLQVTNNFDLGVIQSELGSCATLVWNLLRQEDFDFAVDKDIPASLYYGLYKDTNSFTEISHPLDKDMRDSLVVYCDRGIITRLRHCNFTVDELEVAGVALLRNTINYEKRYALFKSEPCDPNMLGVISDLGLQIDVIDLCVVYSERESGARISIRSCSKEIMASEFVEYITADVGSGGGHKDKAGGSIQKSAVEKLGMTIADYMKLKTSEYFDSFDVIYADDHNMTLSDIKRYIAKPIPKGIVISTDVFAEGTRIMVRSLVGDVILAASPDIYLMVGVKGEVHPMKATIFHSRYVICEQSVRTAYTYIPTAKNAVTGEVKELLPYIKTCVANENNFVYAKSFDRNTKIFTEWNPNGYLYGKKGDYLVIQCDNSNDMYVIKKNIFNETYIHSN